MGFVNGLYVQLQAGSNYPGPPCRWSACMYCTDANKHGPRPRCIDQPFEDSNLDPETLNA